MSAEPAWLLEGRQYVGQSEIPGRESNPWIRQLWFKLGGGWLWNAMRSDDSASPWCGTFVAAVLRDATVPLPAAWYRARAWLDWGTPLQHPAVGCVVVYERGGGGHVGFIVGQDAAGRLLTLGGNQGDRVSIAPFERSRVLGYRWPPGRTAALLDYAGPLPLLASTGTPSSSNEA